MIRRLIAAIRVDLVDARTAFELRSPRYAIPAVLFGRLFGRS
jgi:hypothetical protein